MNLNCSLDYVVDVAAPALLQIGTLKNHCREQSGMENHSRRSNHLFYGINEERGETDSDYLLGKFASSHRCWRRWGSEVLIERALISQEWP